MNTMQNSKGQTMYRTVIDGVDYGFMTARAQRALIARLAGK